MGWHGVANVTPGQQDTTFLPPPENFLAICYCCFLLFFYDCFIIVAKERSAKIVVEINLGLFNIQENSILSCINFIHLIVIT